MMKESGEISPPKVLPSFQMYKFLLVLLCAFCISSLQVKAQDGVVKIDLKTKISDKTRGNHVNAVKAGISEYLNNKVPWIRLVNVGEKYSLWVENFNIRPDVNDPFISTVQFDLELKTPAMIRRGKPLANRRITMVVDTREPFEFSEKGLEDGFSKVANQANSIAANPVAMLATGGKTVFISVGISLVGKSKKKFNNAEMTIGLLAGMHSLAGLHEMLKEVGF